MAVFLYEARTADGRKIDGSLKAKDRNAAQGELKKKNLNVLVLSEQRKTAKKGLFGPPRPRVKTKDIAVLTRQLATMISAGIPLLESLEILHEQVADPGFKLVLDKVIDRIRSGSDFSTALAEHPKIFSGIFVNMIRAGEAAGQLDTILNRLADYTESIEELKHEIKAAMTYPVISLCLILAITVGLVVGIVPKFKEIFVSLGMEKMPLPTEILMGISNFCRNNFIIAIIGIFVIVFAFLSYIKTKQGKKQWHWFLLHMPIFGPLFRKVAISRFSRTFSTLIQSGVPMLSALDIVAGTSGNVIIEAAVLKAKEAVSRGETLGDPLTETGVFPPMVTRMIAIGEKTGALEKLLSKISDFYDSEVRTTVKALSSIIEPLLIALMGVIVGLIVLSIFLPIIQLQQKLAS
ncbi:MAG: type II secretion system F family protein [Planctomycetota bacterium]|jgi:type IV pilus assembly protein PilC